MSRGTRIIQRLVYTVLVTAFLLAYLALFVPPRWVWWLQLLAPTVPVFSGLIVLATWWVYRAANRLLWFGHVVFLVLVVVRFAPESVPGSTTAIDDRDALTVMSYNSKLRYPEAQAQLEALIRSVQPEIVSMQEASMFFVDDYYGASAHVVPLWNLGPYNIDHPKTHVRSYVDLPIFSTLRSMAFTEARLADPVYGNLGALARAQMRWKGRTIVVYNVHLRSYLHERGLSFSDVHPSRWLELLASLRRDVLVRARQAERVREQLEAEDQPFLLTGDFNATAHNWEYRYLSRELQDVAPKMDTWWKGTFPSRVPLLRIDFVLASGEWDVLHAATGPSLTSDHRLVMAALVLRPRS